MVHISGVWFIADCCFDFVSQESLLAVARTAERFPALERNGNDIDEDSTVQPMNDSWSIEKLLSLKFSNFS